jgi:hypothetical protein
MDEEEKTPTGNKYYKAAESGATKGFAKEFREKRLPNLKNLALEAVALIKIALL